MGSLQIGDRVTVKVNARPAFNGVIAGEGRNGRWWLVIKDGTKSKNGYAKDFCKPENAKGIACGHSSISQPPG